MKMLGMDWKYFTTLAIGVVGLAIPFYFSQAELNSHSLTLRLVTSSGLQEPVYSELHDLQITVNGTQIKSPYISSLVLINTGSKPIASSDFETPIMLSSRYSKLISAQITGTEPDDIPAKILLEDGKLKIPAFLSNPKDQIKITLVSSGMPDFLVGARIAGVKEVVYEDQTKQSSQVGRVVTSATLVFLSLSMYGFFFFMAGSRNGLKVDTAVRMITIVCLAGGTLAYAERVIDFFEGGTKSLVILLFLASFAFLLGYGFSRNHRRKYGPPS
ncbi:MULTISPECIES: hypothetical protein [unclassified Pseudomonas]|uniref:hypothetical protein n=1 Tax=unclassified Pseudomonas TaxID=196821 RepID=UPI000C86A081|nr:MULTISPECIES: hypothetical protein [unclassified Pseudomonas]PMV27246.1 hypothetical protein C1X17_00225 [Pseudomonas sp. FW305-3-2-15-C-TSA2]PMV32501.1 hypothetical protein C1X22_00225 [Pseudomonas sp. DP16D-L5]PMV42215.1 hypothetical protein C1X21_00225 [Pseudomonas sp. FW305-3-2-15-A-LB2]PMV49745.1 hypothetical protein C1X16_02175 [Pseudomonas sp. FW305-3-2-15-C-R2A1]PMV55139.1 hypothetical protein C1X18_00225 [Pseudomonas sp. FW305-3-2-15-C-LB1]